MSLPKNLFSLSWPYLAVIFAHLIWGSNFVVAKLTLQEIPPMSLGFLRFALASILLIPFVLTHTKKIKLSTKDLPRLFAVGVLMASFNIALFYAGLSRTTAISASVLTMTIPIISVFFGWLFLKEKVYIVNLAGIVLGLAGAILIVGLPLFFIDAPPSSENMLGNFLLIIASISWVTGATISKSLLKKYTTLTVTAIIFAVGALTFLLPALNEYNQNPNWPSHLTYIGILGLLFITILSSISGYFLFEWGVQKLGVIKADFFQYIEPIMATILAILILGEQPRVYFVIGAVLIALGVYWGTLAKEHHRHHKAHRV